MDIKIPEGRKNTALLVVVGSTNKDSDVTSIKLGDDTQKFYQYTKILVFPKEGYRIIIIKQRE